MKNLILLVLAFFNLLIVSGQASYTSVSYNKANQPGLMLDLPYKEEVVEDFIVDNLERIGYDVETKGKLFWKQNKLDGYYIFKDVRLEGIASKVDLYFKVDQKGRRSKDESIIYMLIARQEAFVSSTSDEATYNAGKRFLNGFVDQAAFYKLNLDIREQEEAVKDAEKKLDRIKDDEKDLEKKIGQLQKNLKENREDQEDQQRKIQQERQKLVDLRSKKG